ncbi:hypothetical protein CHS0354_034675 [Potamilus streckersoni]|uniref:Uncharacterized protein n=1 Tax=Potamilus streckersoni TaxID=2493646 RepID=A0AAE0WBM2_9BIVA|nr:hypothetical protein CHS0354_034675 [Potamilus streckersoni]
MFTQGIRHTRDAASMKMHHPISTRWLPDIDVDVSILHNIPMPAEGRYGERYCKEIQTYTVPQTVDGRGKVGFHGTQNRPLLAKLKKGAMN